MCTGAEIALIATAVIGTGASMSEAHQQRKAQKTQQRNQRAAIAKEEADALEKRKQQIGQLRKQMNIGGYQTQTPVKATTPVKGTLGETLG